MTDAERDAYVRAALVLQGYRLGAQETAAVVAQFARIEALAANFINLDLPHEDEPAPVFRL